MGKRLIDANYIVEVAEHAFNEWNLAMAAADGKREITLVFKRQELCKAVKAVAEKAPTVDCIEVVRCGQCVFRKATDGAYKVFGWNCANKLSPCRGRIVSNADFCPYGESEAE